MTLLSRAYVTYILLYGNLNYEKFSMSTKTLLNLKMLSRVLAKRSFATSRVIFQKKTGSLDSQLLKAQADSQLNLSSQELIYKPELWKGLPSNVVVQLYRARVIALGKNYKRCQDELDALLQTATNPLEANAIYNIYNSSESNVFKADTDTDYENYVVEGEYMDDKLEPYKFDEYPTSAQDIVRDFRDVMEFNRKAAFELPQLTKYKQEYEPTNYSKTPITYKYTRFIGESHPAERKVAVQIKVSDLGLNEAETHKLKLLAGQRYNHIDDLLVMSSDKFIEPAQNASFLNDIINDLIVESKSNPEEFADVPLDKRHTEAKLLKKTRKNKRIIPFPKEWERPIKPEDRTIKLDDFVPGLK